ncbi:hypothetical protein N9W79_00570 [bacterium]|nr:hypothetical protein [bacterium]
MSEKMVVERENRVLQIFNNLWIYLILGVGVVATVAEHSGSYVGQYEADKYFKLACFLLLPAPIFRNIIRIVFKVKLNRYKDVIILSVPVVLFAFAFLKLQYF